MRSEPAAVLSGAAELLRSSEPLAGPPVSAQAASLLEEATDLLVLHRDFAAAVERCEAGCDSLGPAEAEAGSSAEVRCSLCVVGIQAMAELNRWREVLSWVLQYYHVPEHLPPKVLELCILLYSRVREPQVMLEVGSSWLRDITNKSLPEYGSLLELYVLRVLLPLGQFEGAEELVRGCDVFDSAQQLALLKTICESKCQWTQQEEMHSAAEEQQDTTRECVLGALSQKLLTTFTLLRRALSFSHVTTVSLQTGPALPTGLGSCVFSNSQASSSRLSSYPCRTHFFYAAAKVSVCLEDFIRLFKDC
ncbi:peroxisome assembly protein 26 isoform X3 [Dromaius novaehollandiae]|uniref:peroxisome assembly protein 26 isoform X3 n=1 Tax=Dromaius novaehollandiae TaxID=8790 RepID=UPI00311DDE6A